MDNAAKIAREQEVFELHPIDELDNVKLSIAPAFRPGNKVIPDIPSLPPPPFGWRGKGVQEGEFPVSTG